jgi:hypothetical protein
MVDALLQDTNKVANPGKPYKEGDGEDTCFLSEAVKAALLISGADKQR